MAKYIIEIKYYYMHSIEIYIINMITNTIFSIETRSFASSFNMHIGYSYI